MPRRRTGDGRSLFRGGDDEHQTIIIITEESILSAGAGAVPDGSRASDDSVKGETQRAATRARASSLAPTALATHAARASAASCGQRMSSDLGAELGGRFVVLERARAVLRVRERGDAAAERDQLVARDRREPRRLAEGRARSAVRVALYGNGVKRRRG